MLLSPLKKIKAQLDVMAEGSNLKQKRLINCSPIC